MPRDIRINRYAGITSWEQEFLADVDAQIRERVEGMAKDALRRMRRGTATPGPAPSQTGEYPRKQSGTLNKSYAVEMLTGTRIGWKIKNTSKQGWFMEKGVRGGKIIRPKKGKFLRFRGKNGAWVFAKRIKQGRIVPRHHLQRGMSESLSNMRRQWAAPLSIKAG